MIGGGKKVLGQALVADLAYIGIPAAGFVFIYSLTMSTNP